MPNPAEAPVCLPTCWWYILRLNKTRREFYSFRQAPRWTCPYCRRLRATRLADHLATVTDAPHLWVARFEEPDHLARRRLNSMHHQARRVGAGRLVITRGEQGWERNKSHLLVTDHPNLSPRTDIFTRYPAVAARALARYFCWQRGIERAVFLAPWPKAALERDGRPPEGDEHETIGTFPKEDIDDIIACYPSPTDEDLAEIRREIADPCRTDSVDHVSSSWTTLRKMSA